MTIKFKVGHRVASADKPNLVKRIVAILPDGLIHCQWMAQGKRSEGHHLAADLRLIPRYLPLCVVERMRL